MSAARLINPATEEVLRSVEHAGAAAVDDAVDRARAAQRRWARLPPAERAAGLRAFADAVDAHLGELAALEVANSGHPIASAEWEAGHVRDVLNFYAASPERLSGKQIPVAGGLDVTFHEPMGLVGVITPWNFPMPIASWGFAPALAAGNAVLIKPAEATPLTTIRLGELAVQAGLDADLLQVLPGRGAVVGERFVTHPGIRKIVFTGSTDVGKQVMSGAAAQVKRVTLELGGKSANIVFADCDLERANSPPTGTVVSSSAVMLISTPATGEGISVSTLSVDTSTSASSTWTESPTFLSQRVTVPSATDSPSSGINTGVAAPPPEPCWAGAGSGWACGCGSGWASGCAGAADCGCGSGWLGAGAAGCESPPGAPPSEASPMTASSPPTSTVSSSWATILVSTPAAGDGISVSTLSVDTSTSGSSSSTVSPSCLSQRVTVPSVTLSPSAGIWTEKAISFDSSIARGSGRVDQLLRKAK